jgi:hypothetical protein
MAEPVYELYVKIEETGEYTRWKYIWNEFGESYPGVKSYISSHFYFDEKTGSLSLEFTYSEFMTFKERFMAQASGISFKVAARLPGSEYEGAKADFMVLQHVDFRLEFIEPEEANACMNHKLVLSDTEVTGGETREPEYEVYYDVAAIGADVENIMTINALKVVSNIEGCPRNAILEYYDQRAWNEEHQEEGAWVELPDNEFVTTDLSPDVMTV